MYKLDKKRQVGAGTVLSLLKNQTNQIQPRHTALVLNILPKLDICTFQLFDYLMQIIDDKVNKCKVGLTSS